jgi:hypothetical protein
MNRVDLAPENKGPFKTTGEVVADPTLIENRLWGQRGQAQGDMYFPKENIKARGEVTAADLYTKLRSHGFQPEPMTDVNQSDKYFMNLAKQLSTVESTSGRPVPINQVLENIATPGVVQAAKAGITAPARALATAGPLAAPLALVSQIGGSSRINKKFDETAANAQMLRAEAARKRGGKWRFPTPFGQVTVPEFGISESGGLHFR